MTTKTITMTREELHQKVWATPLSRLASEFGISDVAIGKICNKFNIPKPRAGYWQMIQHGHKVRVIPLPAAEMGMQNEIEIVRTESKRFQVQDATIARLIESLSKSDAMNADAPDLRKPHPLVAAAKTLLERGSPGEFGYLVPKAGSGHAYLDVRVSQTSLTRALRIMNAILITLYAQGYHTEVQKGKPFHTYVHVDKETVKFRLSEHIQRSPRELTPAELAKPHYDPSIRWNFTNSGLLTFKIDEFYPDHGRKTWTDREHRTLENQLNEIVIGILRSGEALRLKTLEHEEREKKHQEVRQKEEQEKHLQAVEDQRGKVLESMAQSWKTCQNINAFLDAVENFKSADKNLSDSQRVLSAWLSWARSYSRQLNPLEVSNLKRLIETLTSQEDGV